MTEEFTLRVCSDGFIKDFFRCGNCEQLFYTSKYDREKMNLWALMGYPNDDDKFLRACPCGSQVYLDGCEEPDIPIYDVFSDNKGSFYPVKEFEEAHKKRLGEMENKNGH